MKYLRQKHCSLFMELHHISAVWKQSRAQCTSSSGLSVYGWMGCVAMCSLAEWRDYQTCRLAAVPQDEGKMWRLMLRRGQARLWWFRQTVAVTACRETEVVVGGGPSLPLCLSTDNSCRLRVANRYIKAVKGPLRHDDGFLQEQPALWCWILLSVTMRIRSLQWILSNDIQ